METINEKGDRVDQIEVYENDIDLYLHQFTMENDIDNLRNASQSVWNACLMYICRHVFKGTDKLKGRKMYAAEGCCAPVSTFNAYNYELVNEVCDYYISLCMLYDKEVSIMGFSNLTGINQDTLHDWGNNSVKSSTVSCEITKKILAFREESLSNKLATGNKNPVGILAILNRHYAWNLPGVSRENSGSNKLTAADLPRLGGSVQDQTLKLPSDVSEGRTNDEKCD